MQTPDVELILDFFVVFDFLSKKKLTVPQLVPASTEVENVVHRDMR